ncbi:hypothetical protein M3Y97_00675800 [Aphelenchoides bicaudatus]|nr:hypothetical protein M3Y97_00675800 [Aphelenchoides bicaudatus]
MNSNIVNERQALAQLIKNTLGSAQNGHKENGNFLENFRQLLSEGNTDDLLGSGAESPEGDDEIPFSSPPQKSSFLSQITMEKDPVEVRAQLIQLVRRTPELYDKNDPRYKNNAHKGVLWSRIAKEIGNGATGKKVREQWSYMRRKYEEEYHSRLAGNAPTPMDPSKRHLFTYDQLSFLEPYISSNSASFLNNRSESPMDRPPLSHQNSSSDAGSGRQSRADCQDDFGNSVLTSNLNQLLLQLTATINDEGGDITSQKSTTPAKTPRLNGNVQDNSTNMLDIDLVKRKRRFLEDDLTEKRPNGEPEAEIANLSASVLCLGRSLEELLAKGSEDDCSIFGRQIANDLRNLSKKRRLTVRKQISDLLVQQLNEESENDEKDENNQKMETENGLDALNNN